MRGIVVSVFCMISLTSLSEAYSYKNRKPNLEVFEVLQNQHTKDIRVQPVDLQFDLESKEAPQNKILRPTNKKRGESSYVSRLNSEGVDDLSQYLLQKLKDLKDRDDMEKNRNTYKKNTSIVNQKKEPFILVLSANNNHVSNLDGYQTRDSVYNGFVDETRTQAVEPGNEVEFHIVPLKEENNSGAEKNHKILQNQLNIGRSLFKRQQDRTVAPRSNRYYDYDEK